MRIYYKKKSADVPSLEIIAKGDWIDLTCVDSNLPYNIEDGKQYMGELGIAMQLPEGYEAIIAPRSSTYKNFGIIVPNSIGVIDNSYRGDNDYWKFPFVVLKQPKNIENLCRYILNKRVCQFRIQLSQKATMWQKIKHLFINKIEFIEVGTFGEETNRGGFGSTGI